jgi:hypothetical protein
MFEVGETIVRGEQIVKVIRVLKRGELPPHYVVQRKGKHGPTIITVSESVLSGKERWSEIDSVRDHK